MFADILVINKSDAADSVEMAKIREAAAKLPGRMVVVTAHDQISATLLHAPARNT